MSELRNPTSLKELKDPGQALLHVRDVSDSQLAFCVKKQAVPFAFHDPF